MLTILILAFVVYFFYKISPPKYNPDEIKNELTIVLKESNEDFDKNKNLKNHYLNFKNSISSQLNELISKENLSHDNLVSISNALKIMVESAEKIQKYSSFTSGTKCGSAYTLILFCDEIIQLTKDKETIINQLIDNCEAIINLINFNNSKENIYEEIQKLTKYETNINNIDKAIQFKQHCIAAINRQYLF